MIDPDDYVITRKRKKYRFAKFANSPLCYEFDQWEKQSADVVELGAGTALFSVELAERYPNKNFVAVDVKADRLQKGAYVAASRGLTNIRFLRARADQLADCFKAGSVESLWLTFPDPFPKKRSSGRRMTHPNFLKLYKTVLRPGGSFILKHDSSTFFHWSLEQLVDERWRIEELSFDLHESDLAEEYKTKTSYENRWMEQGSSIGFVRASC